MHAKTLHQAEKKALDGKNESQDTLVLAHHLMMGYGVGLRSSSPPAGAATSLPAPNRNRSPSARDFGQNSENGDNPTDETRGTRSADDNEQSQCSSIPETQDAGLPSGAWPTAAAPAWDAAEQDGLMGDSSLPRTFLQTDDPAVQVDVLLRDEKMDSTQSPTQSNDGRSYDQYYRTSPGAPAQSLPKPVEASSPDGGVLDDDVAVQFNFANAAETDKTASPGRDESGFVDFGSFTHFRPAATQKTAPSPTQQWPETPAQPQNPFRHSRSQLLPTSQLFRATQLSSPLKVASPTSSRPSPADFPGNSISPNPVVSSPLKARGLRSSPPLEVTSSPGILPGTTSPEVIGKATSSAHTYSTGNPVVPESSQDGPGVKKSGPEPMATHEPMRKSQERRSTSGVHSDPVSSDEDDDDYDSIARRRKAQVKKEATLKQHTAIRFPRRLKSEDVEVPSTSQRRRTSQADAYLAQCHAKPLTDKDSEGPSTVKESQVPHPPPTQRPTEEHEESTLSDVAEEVEFALDANLTAPPALPRSSTRTTSQLSQSSNNGGVSNADAIPETSPTTERPKLWTEIAPSVEVPSSEVKSTLNFQSSPPAFSTRSRRAGAGKAYPRVLSSSSSLSNLPSTPQLPSPGTASAEPTDSPTGSTIVASSSPAVAQTKRRDARGRLPKLKTGSTESLRHSSRVVRRGSNSTDELSRSVSATPTFEQSLRVSRLSVSRSASRSGRGAMKPPPTQRDPKLFANMAFAISFQSRKPGESNEQYSIRTEFSDWVQKRIKQAGGRILETGFDELFEVLPMGTPSSSPAPDPNPNPESEINLTPEGRATGFTALIADGHSRKVKYMQALALGLPCVAARWVTTCLDRHELVDWAPYLLCAGQSAFLGDAIRSRSLAPYDAARARLEEVVSRRDRLLRGSRILAVVKKAVERKKMAYVFLARVLGASLVRVYTVEEARVEMKAAERAGRPFDWVYVDGRPDEEALFATGAAAGGKKRKRASTAAGGAGLPLVKRIRTLSDELVIQSLILGRLIEEGEMEG